MLEGLQKPVIVTGAQVLHVVDINVEWTRFFLKISIFMLRSDARANMIGALVFAAAGKIKEVCIYFNNKLIRGNRAVKFSADALEGFISPNYPLLATAQLQIESMRFQDKTLANFARFLTLVLDSYSAPDFPVANQFRAVTQLCPHVVVVRLFPTITGELVKMRVITNLHPPTHVKFYKFRSERSWQNRHKEPFYKHSVPGTYHQTTKAYSWPWKMRRIVEWLSSTSVSVCKQLSVLFTKRDRYVSVLVNNKSWSCVLQVLGSTGVIGGFDMTAEAAFTKLCYVLALPISIQQKIEMMKKNLRGELTAGSADGATV